jgi:hypothetical protein
MARVTRTHSSSSDHNTLTVLPVRVRFQRWPGITGPEGDRCIQGIQYAVMLDGRIAGGGTTSSDGEVRISIPLNETATLVALGTEYNITPIRSVRAMVAIDSVGLVDGSTHDDLIPVKRRLYELGYHIGMSVDNAMDINMDRSILEFQVDADIDVDGLVGPNTRTKIRDAAGH